MRSLGQSLRAAIAVPLVVVLSVLATGLAPAMPLEGTRWPDLPEAPDRRSPERAAPFSLDLGDGAPRRASTVGSGSTPAEFVPAADAVGADSPIALLVDRVGEAEQAEVEVIERSEAEIAEHLEGWQPRPAAAQEDGSVDEDIVSAVNSGRYEAMRPEVGEEPVELVELRTEESRTSIDSSGAYVTDFGNGPMHARDDNGDLQPIDTTLRASDRGRFEATLLPVEVEFGPVTSAMAQLTTSRGNTVAFNLAGSRDPSPRVDGSIAYYASVLDGVDIELEAIPSGMKETIVLTGPTSPRTFRFPLILDGVSPKLTDGGDVEFVDTDGEVDVVIPKGWMVDSGVDPETGGKRPFAMKLGCGVG